MAADMLIHLGSLHSQLHLALSPPGKLEPQNMVRMQPIRDIEQTYLQHMLTYSELFRTAIARRIDQ